MSPVDDAMVRRAALAFYRPTDAEGWVVPPILARNMRRALEAALVVVDTSKSIRPVVRDKIPANRGGKSV